jgi:hypothetical protein
MGMIEEQISKNWELVISFTIEWILPFALVFGAIYLGYRLKKGGLKIMPEEEKEELTIIRNAKVKLDAKDTEKATGMEVTTPTELNNIRVDVTAENVKEATGFRSIQTNKPNALFTATIMCSCGKPFTYTSAGYKPPSVTCPHCGREHEIH